MKRFDARTVAILSVMTALVTVFTLTVRVPMAPTRGYINFADVAIYFAAFTFGPWVGLLAGGIGTGLADAIGGYPQWTLFSFLIHGLQGFLAGWLSRRAFPSLSWILIGWAVGAVVMVAGYFLVGSILYGAGPAAVEAPGNFIQNLAGGFVGIPLFWAVRRAYPPITSMAGPHTWQEGKYPTPHQRG
ncbi:MAG: ECF transporter S component [Chloroflexi bacterium]|nr:ECF transporter S component [Chloroflexota bacterium]